MLFGKRSLDFIKGARPVWESFLEVVADAPGREEVMNIVKGRYERLRGVGSAERLIGGGSGR